MALFSTNEGSHDSLKVSNGKWYWNSRGLGGKTAIDFPSIVNGMDFVGAVEQLTSDYIALCIGPTRQPMKKPKQRFTLPQAARCTTI